MATTPEGAIKKKLDRMLKTFPDIWLHSPQAGPFGSSGVPDRLVCYKGHLVGIEAKANKSRKPTALQEACMRKITAAGGKCFVVYDDDTIDEVRIYLASS
jgi:hypothetical protein